LRFESELVLLSSTVQARSMTISGLYVPLITPFDESGGIALDALAALAHQVLDGGATGLVALGTSGEPFALAPSERAAVLDVVAGVARERDAGLLVGANTADEVAALGGTPALTLVPPFVRPGEDAVVAHFASFPGPLVVYDIPFRTGQYLSVSALRRLAALPGVVGVKYSPGGINDDTIALLSDPPDGFAILGGEDAFIAPLLALGADGGILVSAHLATEQFAALIEAWLTGDVARARPLGRRLARLSAALFAQPNPAVVKAVLHAQGRIPTPQVRPPLLPATPSCTAAALELLPARN